MVSPYLVVTGANEGKKTGHIPPGWEVFLHILPFQARFHREKSFGRVLSVTSFYPGDK
jgi:hypothetical protein